MEEAVVAKQGRASPAYSLPELRDELYAAGLGRPAAFRSYAKFFSLVAAAFAILLWAAGHSEWTLWVRVPLFALFGWLLTSAAMCGHDGAHGATSARPWLNTLLAQLGFTFLGGLSVTYWRHKHNALHHPNVNMAIKDPDVEQSLLALSTRQHMQNGRFLRWLQRHFQAIGFWCFGAPLVLIDLQITSLHYDLAAIFGRRATRAHWLDLGWIASHYVVWLALPLLFWPVGQALGFYALCTIPTSFFLSLVFAPAHVPYPVVKEAHDPLLLQLTSTRNLKTNWFFRFTLIGLDHQIEHHLAPTLTHFDLVKAEPIVKAYCAKHALPYHETSWLRALWDTHVEVRDGWRIDEVVVGAPG